MARFEELAQSLNNEDGTKELNEFNADLNSKTAFFKELQKFSNDFLEMCKRPADNLSEEEQNAEFKLTFGCLSDLQENNLFLQSGWLEETDFKKAVGTCIKICEAYQNFLVSKV